MTLLTVGLSHRTAPVPVLERVSAGTADATKVLDELISSEVISEVLLVSTCNRIEVYADVSRFHPAVAEISAVLARLAGVDLGQLGTHLYVHFADAAAQHLFRVAAGLDSMVVGESQIIGQLRTAYAVGTEAATVGRVLHEAVQTALRTGKSVHSDTGIDQAGASIVSVALDRAETLLGGLAGRSVLIVGAGSMGALAAATARRRGLGPLVVANRSEVGARRLALAVDGRAVGLSDTAALHAAIADADVLISATGSTGQVLGVDDVADRSGHALVVLDLALPRDVDPAVATIPDVHYVDLDVLGEAGAMVSDAEVEAAADIVAEHLRVYLDQQLQLAVAPTVTALRARASQVVDAELRRLEGRVPDLDGRTRREVADAVRRAVEKVLHAPTVRVKEMASTPEGDLYAATLRALFDLDPTGAQLVAELRPDLASAAGAPVDALLTPPATGEQATGETP